MKNTKHIITAIIFGLFIIFSSCNNANYYLYEFEDGRTSLTIDGTTIYFDTKDECRHKTIDRIYSNIKYKRTVEIYDSEVYKQKMELAAKGLSYLYDDVKTYSKISINYEDHNKTVVIKYEDYCSGKLSSSSTIYVPYKKALKIFSKWASNT